MRHIPLSQALMEFAASADGPRAVSALARAHLHLSKMPDAARPAYIERNGARKWSAHKNHLVGKFGKKCWYTEAEIIGAHLTIDHYRPKALYWWLAFEPDNYRVACPFANSPEDGGGKSNHFPLTLPAIRATGPGNSDQGDPVILDPCRQEDVALLAFQSDGQVVIHPDFAHDPIAVHRVTESKVLLNLQHADFNAKRAELYETITEEVADIEGLPHSSARRVKKIQRLERRLAPDAPYSTAARFYLMAHRYLDWVETMLGASITK